MSMAHLPFDQDRQLLLAQALREGLPKATWPTSSPTRRTSWTRRRSRLAMSGSAGGVPPYRPRMMVKG